MPDQARLPGRARVFIKVCGITRVSDAQVAVRAGANAVGFLFAPSPRRIPVSKARTIGCRVHPAVSKIGVFVDSSERAVLEVVDAAGLDGVQLQGSESPQFCAHLKSERPDLLVFKALRITTRDHLHLVEEYKVDAILVDSKDPSHPLRQATSIPWEWLRDIHAARYLVAGGLTPENVGPLVRRLSPWGVDVSRGVESEPGRKDASKVRSFIQAVRDAEVSTAPATGPHRAS
jgi:phosphoribosylanthranilate isomerase